MKCSRCKGTGQLYRRYPEKLAEAEVRRLVKAYAPGAMIFHREDGYAVDWPIGDRFLTTGAPSRRAAWRRALKFCQASNLGLKRSA